MLCSKITVIVNDQNKEHGKKIAISAVKVGEGKSKEDIKEVHTEPVESYSAKDTGEKSII